MQNLIVGERYYVKHRQGIWEGEVTFYGIKGALLLVKDINVTGGNGKEYVSDYYQHNENKTELGGAPEWWGFEPVNFSLENE